MTGPRYTPRDPRFEHLSRRHAPAANVEVIRLCGCAACALVAAEAAVDTLPARGSRYTIKAEIVAEWETS